MNDTIEKAQCPCAGIPYFYAMHDEKFVGIRCPYCCAYVEVRGKPEEAAKKWNERVRQMYLARNLNGTGLKLVDDV